MGETTGLQPDEKARLMRAADRVEIIETLSRYHHLIDSRELDALPMVFTHDAECSYSRVRAGEAEMSFPTVSGIDAIREWLSTSLRPTKTMHYMTNHVFLVLEPDRARTRSYLSVKGSPDTGGLYRADHVRTDHGWRIQRLTLRPHFGDFEATS